MFRILVPDKEFGVRAIKEDERWYVVVGLGDPANWQQVAKEEVVFKLDDPPWFDRDSVRFYPRLSGLLIDNFGLGYRRGFESGYHLGLAAAREELARNMTA